MPGNLMDEPETNQQSFSPFKAETNNIKDGSYSTHLDPWQELNAPANYDEQAISKPLLEAGCY